MHFNLSILLVALLTLMPVTSSARADSTPAPLSPSTSRITFSGIAAWLGGLGGGIRYQHPLTDVGILDSSSSVRDKLVLEAGADFISWDFSFLQFAEYRWNEVRPTVGALWLLEVNDHWTFYPRIDLSFHVGWYSGLDASWNIRGERANGLGVDLAVGALYDLGGLAIHGELGALGAKLGASIPF